MRLGEETYSVDPMHPHFETMCKFQAHAVIGITRPYGLKAAINGQFYFMMSENFKLKLWPCKAQ